MLKVISSDNCVNRPIFKELLNRRKLKVINHSKKDVYLSYKAIAHFVSMVSQKNRKFYRKL
jgi:hypothetical protein